jgi:hypothetical protein
MGCLGICVRVAVRGGEPEIRPGSYHLNSEDRIMKAKNGGRSTQTAEDDFGLESKVQEYHRHGGSQGSDHAKTMEGEIAATDAQHGHQLRKARPDSSAARRK